MNKTAKIRKLLNGLVLLAMVLIFCACGAKEEAADRGTEEWTIRQFGTAEGSQESFWTVEDSEGNIVIIDGGFGSWEGSIRKYLEKFDNHVSAWIITHAHPDHVDAFNTIMANPGDIVVDDIYTIEVNDERYRETVKDYDDVEVYDAFLDIIGDLDNVHYLKEDDELDLLGLRMKVLHAWDEDTDALSKNLMNNGSMMFTLTGNEDCILFCADVENETEQFVIERHKDELAEVDYLQAGHHGNWGMTTDFYDHVNPVEVYFDAPNWLIEAEDKNYNAYELADYFEGRGIEVKSFKTAPNKLVLN